MVLENRSHKVAEKLLFNFISLQKSMDCMMIFNMYFIACLKKKNLWNRSLHRKKTWRSKIDLMTFFYIHMKQFVVVTFILWPYVLKTHNLKNEVVKFQKLTISSIYFKNV